MAGEGKREEGVGNRMEGRERGRKGRGREGEKGRRGGKGRERKEGEDPLDLLPPEKFHSYATGMQAQSILLIFVEMDLTLSSFSVRQLLKRHRRDTSKCILIVPIIIYRHV